MILHIRHEVVADNGFLIVHAPQILDIEAHILLGVRTGLGNLVRSLSRTTRKPSLGK